MIVILIMKITRSLQIVLLFIAISANCFQIRYSNNANGLSKLSMQDASNSAAYNLLNNSNYAANQNINKVTDKLIREKENDIDVTLLAKNMSK